MRHSVSGSIQDFDFALNLAGVVVLPAKAYRSTGSSAMPTRNAGRTYHAKRCLKGLKLTLEKQAA